MALYQVPDAYAGKSLNQIQQQSGMGFRPDVLASFGGIDPNQVLSKGQQLNFNLPTNYQSSSEGLALNNIFGQALDPAIEAAKKANQFQIDANAPAISAVGSSITNTQNAYGSAVGQYQSEIPNIQNQYQDILNQITKGVGASYAQRGLSNNSPQMSIDNATAQLPAANQQSNALNQFLNSIAGLQTGGAATVGNLQQILGGLQSGNPLASLQQGLSAAQLPYQNSLTQANAALANAQAAASNYIPIPNLGALNVSSGNILSPYSGGGAASGYVLGSDGHYYQKVA